MTDAIPEAVSTAVAALWARRGPRPDNTFETPEFVRLKDACIASYQVGAAFWFAMSLWEILKSLGCAMLLPKDQQALALTAAEAERRQHVALTASVSKVVHLCPLDWADGPPAVRFGSNRINRFSADELRAIADAPRIARAFPSMRPDWDRLAQFHWLVVEETLPITVEPGARTNPFMYEVMHDLGAITAHEGRFPEAVEEALFLLLLAPWEDWAEAQEVDWRGFRIPWVYSMSDDLCVPLKSPPLDSSLTWLPEVFYNAYGEPEEFEVPARFSTADEATTLPDYASDAAWADLVRAARSPLFETPIRHFLVRAFHSTGIDEFIAHLTVLEAALGLQSDYGGKRAASDPRKGRKATQIMMARVAALLDDAAAAVEFEELFNLRSAYVHGRPMAPISSVDWFRARRLARRVVVALVRYATGFAGAAPLDREAFLVALMDRS